MARALAIALVLFLAALPARAQPAPRRHIPPAPLQNDEPDLEDDDPEAEQAVPDQPDDDPREDQPHARPGAPRRQAPTMPSSPGEDEEEPSAPPDLHRPSEGPAEPASATQPLAPQ